MPSMTNVVVMTTVSTSFDFTELRSAEFVGGQHALRGLRWWFTANAIKEANVMTPRPPICTAKMSTPWPKVVQCVVELTMEIPHVEMADTAVKNAVVNVVVSSFGVAMGVISNVVDNAASVRK